jgi:CBS domain-containing protein
LFNVQTANLQTATVQTVDVQTAQQGETIMQVSAAMNSYVKIATPDQTIRDAARLMAQIDAGSLPVGDNDRLAGMITDRDIAIRAVGHDKGPMTRVREVMTAEIRYCFEDEDVAKVCAKMGKHQIRRLPVLNHSKRLVGILSLGDLARADGGGPAAGALRNISRPGGAHSQSDEVAP